MSFLSKTPLRRVPLKQITTKIGSGATPRGGKNSYKSKGLSLVRSQNVFDFCFVYDGLAFIDETQADGLLNVKVEHRDIFLNITGASVARCCMVPDRILPARVNQHVAIVRVDRSKAYPYYVLCCINSPSYKDYLLAIAQGGATREALTKEKIENFEIPLPPLPAQHKIASILSNYDDLIENNLRRIKILEEMAQNLYREWFVKFRFPGHENVQMVDSQLGKIPDGWEVGSIGDICQVLTGFAFKSKDWSENGIPVIKIKNIRPGNLVETEKADHVPEDIIEQKHEKYYLINGDFLIAMTGATAGKVGKLRTSKQMALNQRVAKIEPTDGFYQYVWCRISNPEAEKEFYRLADGAAQPNMSSSQIEGVSLLIPSSEVRGRFAMIVSPILQQVDNLIFQNTTLRQTRDLLLPKLISGELDVSELEIKTGVS